MHFHHRVQIFIGESIAMARLIFLLRLVRPVFVDSSFFPVSKQWLNPETNIEEDLPYDRLTLYDKAKRAAEDVVVEAGAKYGLHVVGLRLATVYGLGGRRNLERMVRGRSVERSVKRSLRSINWLCLLFAGAN